MADRLHFASILPCRSRHRSTSLHPGELSIGSGANGEALARPTIPLAVRLRSRPSSAVMQNFAGAVIPATVKRWQPRNRLMAIREKPATAGLYAIIQRVARLPI